MSVAPAVPLLLGAIVQRPGKRDIKSFHFPPAPFSGGSLPSPRAAGRRGLGNLSLFVLSRPFWTTFYVFFFFFGFFFVFVVFFVFFFIQAICSPGKGEGRPPPPQPPRAARCSATLPFQPATGCGRGGFLFPLKYSWRGVVLRQRPPPAPPEWYGRLVPDRSLSKDLLKPH